MQPYSRRRFIDKVNRLIGQIAVADIARGKFHGRVNRFVCDFYLVVRLVFITQAFEDFDGFFFGRLADGNRLEPAFKRRVLFNMFAVFFNRGRADHLQFPAGKRGFQNVGGVHCAFGTAGADEGMDFINKQNDVVRRFYFVNNLFNPLFKVAAVFGAGDHAGEVKGNNPFIFQHFRHFPGNDFQRKPLGNRGFTDAGFTD